ncbi:MAG: hypothetical protein GX304_01940 [Clostridiales bacterium]|jgi:hypothetical protein|nr:hypothetical protein [Clostridiales bacterium]
MKSSKKIALCGVSAAIGSIFLSLVIVAPTNKLTLFALASVAVMIPLSQKIYGGAALTMLTIAAMGFIWGGLAVFVPYILLFGAHPLINALLKRLAPWGRKGIIIGLVVKLIYFNAALYLVYRLAYIMELFAVQVEFLVLAAIVSLIFIPYDFLIMALQKRLEFLISKLIK